MGRGSVLATFRLAFSRLKRAHAVKVAAREVEETDQAYHAGAEMKRKTG